MVISCNMLCWKKQRRNLAIHCTPLHNLCFCVDGQLLENVFVCSVQKFSGGNKQKQRSRFHSRRLDSMDKKWEHHYWPNQITWFPKKNIHNGINYTNRSSANTKFASIFLYRVFFPFIVCSPPTFSLSFLIFHLPLLRNLQVSFYL